MTITLELPPDLEARFVAEAKATGVPVAEVVRGCLLHAFPRCNPQPPTVADIDRAFEEAAGIGAPTAMRHQCIGLPRQSVGDRQWKIPARKLSYSQIT
jgi:hypothetical protein